MQFLRTAVPTVCLLASVATAQVTGAAPGIITKVAKDTVFTASALEKLKIINANGQVKAVVQISMTKTPGVDKPA